MENETGIIKRFDASVGTKITKALSKIFNQTNNCSEDTAITLSECQVTDVAYVCMITAKTEEAKRILSLFVDIDNIPKALSLDYVVQKDDVNKTYTAKYSTEYIMLILNVLKHTQDYIKISLKEDFPSTLETEHFKFLLAPRLEME